MKLKIFSIIVLIGIITACTPAIPKDWLNQVDPEITFQGLIKDPEKYKGKVILVGGQIVSTTMRESESWVEVLQQPLDRKQGPQNTDISYGRFLVRFAGFLDPAIYAGGKKITVLGEVLGKKVQPLNGMEYTYPVLLGREHYLWKPETYGGPSMYFGIGVGGVIH